MPIYEYKCRTCNHKFEELIIGCQEPKECPECGSPKVERQMSMFSSCAPSSGGSIASPGCGGGGGFS